MDNREQTVQPESQEISIREIIETLIKGKLIIAIVTILAIIISGILSFFILPNIYQADAQLLTTPFEFTMSETEGKTTQSSIIEALTKMPNMTIETYIKQLKSPAVLQETIRILDWKNADGQYVSNSVLAGMITISNTDGSNYVDIKVNSQDPQQAALIANTLCDSFIEYVTSSSREKIQQSADLIADQMEIEETKLGVKSKVLNEYWQSNGSIDVLRGEKDNLIAQIVNNKSELLIIETKIAADFEALKALSAVSPSTAGIDLNDFKVIVDSMNTTNSVDQTQLQINLSSDKLSAALLLVDINKIQTSLVTSTYRKQALQNKISEMNAMLVAKQNLLTESEYKYNAIKSDMDMAQHTYEAYQQRYNEIMLIATADVGKTNVTVSSVAELPESPISPNKTMNILIAAVLGLLLSAFIVLFMDYWRKSQVKTAV